MTTRIDINDVQFYAPVGVLEQERQVQGHFRLDMRLYYDATEAMESDDIAVAVNYAEVTAVALEQARRPAALIEHVAARVRHAVVDRFPAITGGSVTITKTHPPIASPTPRVSFTIEW